MFIKLYSNEKGSPVYHYYVPDNTRESDALEEALYVLWELTPTERIEKAWHNLMHNGSCLFDYHGCEFSMIKRIDKYEFQVIHSGNA